MVSNQTKLSTGIQGLDEILLGGLIPNRSYLLQGGPGSGKSTIGFHFLQEAIRNDENALYITLGEPAEEIKTNAQKMGIDLSAVNFLDLTPEGELNDNGRSYTVFHPSEVEQRPLMESIVDTIRKLEPGRIVFDSITMLRFLSRDPFQYRSLGLSFAKFVSQHEATLMMISEATDHISDKDSVFWVDGVIDVKYAPNWRKLAVSKYRGSDFLPGNHAFKITGRGVEVFPRLKPNNYHRFFEDKVLSTGIKELNTLLHGGIEKGTTTLITGPSGVGKTNLGMQFIKEAATRDERSIIYSFEESAELILRRSRSVGIPIDKIMEKGNLKIESIEPLSYSPDEFSKIVRTDVEENDTRIVMIDSLGGYGLAVREENTLERLHSLSVYLQNMGVTTFLINESQNVTGDFTTTSMHASYLADNILFLRYLELNGQMQKAIGVLKKRLSDFDTSIREFKITSSGLVVGHPLKHMRGILTGLPELVGQASP